MEPSQFNNRKLKYVLVTSCKAHIDDLWWGEKIYQDSHLYRTLYFTMHYNTSNAKLLKVNIDDAHGWDLSDDVMLLKEFSTIEELKNDIAVFSITNGLSYEDYEKTKNK